MKLIIIKGNLHDALTIVERSSGDQQNLPILKNVLLRAHQNLISLTTTNLETATTSFVSGKIIEDGTITTPISLFLNITSNLQTERLNLESDKNQLRIQTDNYEASLQTLPTEDFPLIPKIKNQQEFVEFSGEVFRNALVQVAPSAQTNEVRPELSSVLFSFTIDQVKLAATDSFRLSEKILSKQHFTTTHTDAFKILIPIKTIQELIRITKTDTPVQVYHDENQVFFKTKHFELISRLVEGSFPDYEYLIPKKNGAEVLVNREEFLHALKLASVFSPRVYEVKIKIPEHKKHLEIFSFDQTLGENKYLLPAKIGGAAKDTSFNWRFLADGLKALSSEQISLGLNDDNKPGIIRAQHDASYFYILMPILKV